MAIKNLEQELEQIFAQIFKPEQLNPTPPGDKKGKSSGSDDPVRAFLNTFGMVFDIKKTDIVDQVGAWQASDGKTVKSVKQYEDVFKADAKNATSITKLIEDTADEILTEFAKATLKSSNKYEIERIVKPGHVKLTYNVTADQYEKDVYKDVNDLKGEISKKVFSSGKSGKKLWETLNRNIEAIKNRNLKEGSKPKGAGFTMGGVFNVGHAEPVAKMSAAFLADGVNAISDNELISKDISAIKSRVQSKFGKLDLDFTMAREAAVWQNGKLIPNPNQKFYVKTNIETQFKNQIQNQMKGYDEGAGQAGNMAKELLSEVRAYLDKRYKYYTAKGWTAQAMSTPFIDQIGAGLVYHKSLVDLYKRGLAKNITKYKNAPLNTKLQETKPKRKTYKTTLKKFTAIPMSPPKGVRAKQGAEQGLGQGDLKQQRATEEAFKTRAFINAKLAKKVAGNMGRPGLINQSGRFAESVTLTNAASTGNMTHFDYTYNPLYRVFEGGKDFTPNYDPRPLIERSIRQLAAARLETKFTLRRV